MIVAGKLGPVILDQGPWMPYPTSTGPRFERPGFEIYNITHSKHGHVTSTRKKQLF